MKKMSSKRTELIDEINKWQPKIVTDPSFLEIAFFKIFVKFENFITDIIIDYATKTAVNTSKVELRIEFSDRDHFKKVTGLKYLDTGKKTKELVDQIFTNSNNISVFFTSQDSQFFEEMKLLRNYIAHESEESKHKYLRTTLNNYTDFLEPNDFLKSKKRGETESIYTKFVNMVLTYAELIDYD